MNMKRSRSFAMLYAMSALGLGVSFTAQAQNNSGQSGLMLEEIVVTAQRREEFLQDVPISMTVFNQQQLDRKNITNPSELAIYTPSLQTNSRFGADNTTFAIRGFQQELRTTASVGVYFAEVVALRGANAQSSGDGATPGDLFDLANVQVLKGPSGTLFGRNTTGGAVLITPQRPTEEFEGYVEGSAGDYDMMRGQAVVNVPVTDNFYLRFGADTFQRDGYLDNFSGIGPDDFADSDYTAYRISALWEITDSLENYTIFRASESENNGYPASLVDCNPTGALGVFCVQDQNKRIAAGNTGFYDTYNFVPEPVNDQEQGQIINTTTWEISDDFTVKNIIAYGELQTDQRSPLWAIDWRFPPTPTGAQMIFQQVGLAEDIHTTDQESFVEELQFQGFAFDERLQWQAGLYYENSEPSNDYGAQSPAIIICDQASIISSNPADFRCTDPLGRGAVQRVPGGVEYTNQAVYAQSTYDLTEQWAVTAGVRYTDDETEGYANEEIYYFPRGSTELLPYDRVLLETREPEESSSEPTWMVNLDYKPTDDTLLYGKYTRGYRQGSVNVGGSAGYDTHAPEQVDTYELGSKFSFTGSVPATLNMALFYNDFQDQQVQFGYFKPTGVGTTAVVNAGASTIYGLEVEASVQATEDLMFTLGYTYLDTEVDELVFPDLPSAPGTVPSTTTAEGEPLSFAPENKLVMSAVYEIPFVSEDVGEMAFSATYVYTDEMQAAAEDSSPYAIIDDYSLVNFNFDWTGVFGSPVDVSAFVTNATDEEYYTYITGVWGNGLETGQVGMPRMFGARVRYNFGG